MSCWHGISRAWCGLHEFVSKAGFEPTTSVTPIRCSTHWATTTHVELCRLFRFWMGNLSRWSAASTKSGASNFHQFHGRFTFENTSSYICVGVSFPHSIFVVCSTRLQYMYLVWDGLSTSRLTPLRDLDQRKFHFCTIGFINGVNGKKKVTLTMTRWQWFSRTNQTWCQLSRDPQELTSKGAVPVDRK